MTESRPQYCLGDTMSLVCGNHFYFVLSRYLIALLLRRLRWPGFVSAEQIVDAIRAIRPLQDYAGAQAVPDCRVEAMQLSSLIAPPILDFKNGCMRRRQLAEPSWE